MRHLRWLALTPSAVGIVLCLAALSAGAPALAATDAIGLQARTTVISHANERTQAFPRHHIDLLAVRLAAAERVRDRREAARDRAQAAAAAAAARAAAAQQRREQRQQQQAAAPAPQQPSGTVSTAGFSAFEQCVISAESGGNPAAYNPSSGAGGLFQFLLSTWMTTPEGPSYPAGAQTAPAGVQEQAFAWVYARDGTAPWAPYDGC